MVKVLRTIFVVTFFSILAVPMSALLAKDLPLKEGDKKSEKDDKCCNEKKDACEVSPNCYKQTDILVISTNLPGNTGAIIWKVKVLKIGSTDFIEGIVPEGLTGPWEKVVGDKVRIPMNIITQKKIYDGTCKNYCATIEKIMKSLSPPCNK